MARPAGIRADQLKGSKVDPDDVDDENEPDEDDDLHDTGADDDDDDDGDEADEWKPPSREEWERTQAALKKANRQSSRHRLAAKKAAGSAEPDDDAVAAADARAAERWKPRIVKTAARAAFAEAGAKNISPRLLRMIDLEDVDVDEDGEVEGLDEQIEEIKDEYPHLFEDTSQEPAPKRRAGKLDTGARKPAGAPMSATERQVRGIVGKGR